MYLALPNLKWIKSYEPLCYPIPLLLETLFRIDGERKQCVITTNTPLIWDVHDMIPNTRGTEPKENHEMVWLHSMNKYSLDDMIPRFRGLQ